MATTPPRTPNRPAGLNRVLLTAIGLALVLGGAYVLARGLGLLTRVGGPAQEPGSSLLPVGVTVQPWVPYAVIAVAALVGLLCLRWLVAQTGRRAVGQTWRISMDRERGTTHLDTSSAASAFADEVETYTGVSSASAVITGARAQPELHLSLAVEEHAPVNELRDRIDTDALPRLRQALELDALPTEILVRLGAKRASNHLQ
jgi:hypothetical protein